MVRSPFGTATASVGILDDRRKTIAALPARSSRRATVHSHGGGLATSEAAAKVRRVLIDEPQFTVLGFADTNPLSRCQASRFDF